MSKVVRKKKKNPIQILKDMRVIRYGKYDFVIIDRYSLY